MCCRRAAEFGGIFSSVLDRLQKRCCRASSTVLTLSSLIYQVLSYQRSTNVSMSSIMSSDTVTREDASSKNASASSGSTSHTCHAEFLLLPEKNKITSHPVKTCSRSNDCSTLILSVLSLTTHGNQAFQIVHEGHPNIDRPGFQPQVHTYVSASHCRSNDCRINDRQAMIVGAMIIGSIIVGQ